MLIFEVRGYALPRDFVCGDDGEEKSLMLSSIPVGRHGCGVLDGILL